MSSRGIALACMITMCLTAIGCSSAYDKGMREMDRVDETDGTNGTETKIIKPGDSIPCTSDMGFMLNGHTYHFPCRFRDIRETEESEYEYEFIYGEQVNYDTSLESGECTQVEIHKYRGNKDSVVELTLENTSDKSQVLDDCEVTWVNSKGNGYADICTLNNLSIGTNTLEDAIGIYGEPSNTSEQDGRTVSTWSTTFCIQGDTGYAYKIIISSNKETNIIEELQMGIEKSQVAFN